MEKVYNHAKVRYLPWFAWPKYLMDKNKIKSTSGDSSFDQSTMFIPEEEFQHFTPTMT